MKHLFEAFFGVHEALFEDLGLGRVAVFFLDEVLAEFLEVLLHLSQVRTHVLGAPGELRFLGLVRLLRRDDFWGFDPEELFDLVFAQLR